MNTKHVTSLEISKQLAEAGIMFKSEYQWEVGGKLSGKQNATLVLRNRPLSFVSADSAWSFYPAPIATELLERLPENGKVFDIFGKLFIQKTDGVYRCGYGMYGMEVVDIEASADNLPNALALLLIRLTKDGLI